MAGYQIGWKEYNVGGFIPQGELVANVSKLPEGFVFAYWAALNSSTEASFVSRGFKVVAGINVTDPFHRFAFYDGATPYAYAQQYLGGKIVANWTQQDMQGFVNWLQVFGLWSHSFDEVYDQTAAGGPNFVPYGIMQGTVQHNWLDDALKSKIEATGGRSIFLSNYDDKYLAKQYLFRDFNGTIVDNPWTDVNRQALTSQELARVGLPFFNGRISDVARANISVYPGTGLSIPYGWQTDLIHDYGYSRLKKAANPGLLPVGFKWPSIEGYGHYGTYAWRHEQAHGTLYQNEECYWPDHQEYAAVMKSFTRGGGMVCWENMPGQNPATDQPFFDNVQRPGARDVADGFVSRDGQGVQQGPGPTYSHRRAKSINNMTLQAVEDFAELCQVGGTVFVPRAYKTNKGAGFVDVAIDNDIPLATPLLAAKNFTGMLDVAGAGNDAAIYFRDTTQPAGKQQRVQVTLSNNATVEFIAQGAEPVRIKGSFQPDTNNVVAR